MRPRLWGDRFSPSCAAAPQRYHKKPALASTCPRQGCVRNCVRKPQTFPPDPSFILHSKKALFAEGLQAVENVRRFGGLYSLCGGRKRGSPSPSKNLGDGAVDERARSFVLPLRKSRGLQGRSGFHQTMGKKPCLLKGNRTRGNSPFLAKPFSGRTSRLRRQPTQGRSWAKNWGSFSSASRVASAMAAASPRMQRASPTLP